VGDGLCIFEAAIRHRPSIFLPQIYGVDSTLKAKQERKYE